MNSILLIILFLLIGCSSDKDYVKYIYYEDGVSVKEKFIYISQEELKKNKNYQYVSFFENGNLRLYTEIKNGKKNGDFFFYYNNGNFRRTTNYINGMIHGVDRTYNEEERLLTEILYLNDQKIIWKNFAIFDTIPGYSIYEIVNDTAIEYGYYAFNEDNSINQDSWYYYTEAKDTINFGKELDVKVGFYGGYNAVGELQLGELNEKKEFKEIQEIQTFKIKDNVVEFKYKPKKRGNNLILGKIICTAGEIENGVEYSDDFEFIYYHDVYVK